MSSKDFQLYKSLGFLIKSYRQWRGLSQETLAILIRVSVRELRRWETDHSRARIENLHDFSEVTGIPMQVCVALNADQPIWYSLGERRFAYSSAEKEKFPFDELSKYREQIDDGILVKSEPILTDRHIRAILSCHCDIYGTERPLGKDVIKRASTVVPDLNLIAFDPWGHYVGHHVCLPLKMDVYQQLKQEKYFRGCLTTDRISDIVALNEGVFFCYSIFAASWNVGNLLFVNLARYYAQIQQKERYLNAGYAATREAKKICENLGMRMVSSHARENESAHPEIVPAMYETELDSLVRRYEHFGIVQRVGKEVIEARRSFDEKMANHDSLIFNSKKRDDACANPKCIPDDKTGKSNIVSDKVLMALKLLLKGMPLRCVAEVLEVKLNTIRQWLKAASEQSETIDALLMKKLKVSQAELDTLWSSVKNNSLRQRATLWNGKSGGFRRQEGTLS